MSSIQDQGFATYKKKSQFRETWKRYRKNKLALLGLALFCVILVCMVFADVIVDYDKAIDHHVEIRLQGPSKEHPFGTDLYGRDTFARVIHGSRNSFAMGVIAVAVGISLGGILGCAAGYFGGIVDSVIMRILDTVACIPFMLMSLTIVAALGPGLINVLIALMISYIPDYTRIIRASILSVVEQDFIEAAKACGTSNTKIIAKHVLPNALGTIIVRATMSVGGMIINAAGMSFLGMGIQPPAPEWGALLSESREYMRYAPYMAVFPGLAICISALSVNLMGDGLRDALDPRLRD